MEYNICSLKRKDDEKKKNNEEELKKMFEKMNMERIKKLAKNN